MKIEHTEREIIYIINEKLLDVIEPSILIFQNLKINLDIIFSQDEIEAGEKKELEDVIGKFVTTITFYDCRESDGATTISIKTPEDLPGSSAFYYIGSPFMKQSWEDCLRMNE